MIKLDMLSSDVAGVMIFPCITIPDDRGMVMKSELPPFEVKDTYVTTVRPGAIKAWHGYETKRLFWTVVHGLVQLALYDSRKTSPTYGVTDTLFIGTGNYKSVFVPPGVYNGFKGIGLDDAVILVQASEPYNQIHRMPYNSFGYNWDIRHG